MRRTRETLILGLCLALLFCYAGSAKAESSQSNGGSPTARLDFHINIPQILRLQVGSAGNTIDLVTFDVADLPGSGAVAGGSTTTYPIPVEIRALVGAATNVILTADSSTDLISGSDTIPFNQITWEGTGTGFAGSAPFDRTSTQQVAQVNGPGRYDGTYSFSYANANYYPNGTYQGRVTYTLSVP